MNACITEQSRSVRNEILFILLKCAKISFGNGDDYNGKNKVCDLIE